MINEDDVTRKLGSLQSAAQSLAAHVRLYQGALLAARAAGASWPELARAAGVGVGAIRSRFTASQLGGELHIRIGTREAPQIPVPRRED